MRIISLIIFLLSIAAVHSIVDRTYFNYLGTHSDIKASKYPPIQINSTKPISSKRPRFRP